LDRLEKSGLATLVSLRRRQRKTAGRKTRTGTVSRDRNEGRAPIDTLKASVGVTRGIDAKGHERSGCEDICKVRGERPAGVKTQEGIGHRRRVKALSIENGPVVGSTPCRRGVGTRSERGNAIAEELHQRQEGTAWRRVTMAGCRGKPLKSKSRAWLWDETSPRAMRRSNPSRA